MFDVDADGDLDLAFGTERKHLLYLNDGAGVFADVTATHMPSSAYSTYHLAEGDVDGDGDLDLVLGSTYPIGIDGDSVLDLVAGDFGRKRLYANGGSARFTLASQRCLPGGGISTAAVTSTETETSI